MSQVSDNVLRWLYNSLKPEYHDVERTYSDSAETLTRYPTLSPRTEVHTFENGASALLLVLQGTIPVHFRGTTYRYPISIWIPHPYPREAPLVYITPSPDMSVRPGQHVSVEGKVYHPYLADWQGRWQEFSIVALLSVLVNAFSKEPPVVARPKGPPPAIQTPNPGPGAGPAPPPRPNQPASATGMAYQTHGQLRAPLPPPKPGLSGSVQQDGRSFEGRSDRLSSPTPPLPPKRIAHGDKQPVPGRPPRVDSLGPDYSHSLADGPPLPPLPQAPPRSANISVQNQYASHESGFEGGATPYSPNYQSHPKDALQWKPSQHPPIDVPHAPNQNSAPYMQQQLPIRAPSIQMLSPQPQPPQQHYHQHQAQPLHRPPQPQQYPLPIIAKQQPPQPKQPLPDLLSSPTESAPPMTTPSGHAPPVPLNPEKDAILSTISSRLIELLSETTSQNLSAIPALEAQQGAMQRFAQSLTAELGALQQLEATLSNNENILRSAVHEAEKMEKGLSSRGLPGVDEVLTAPTVVGEQLYQLVADERGISDALFVLGRALERDRVSGEVFIKQTRSLAREQFLKKALIKKIANGMGLVVESR